jgi:hypothetical protein
MTSLSHDTHTCIYICKHFDQFMIHWWRGRKYLTYAIRIIKQNTACNGPRKKFYVE